MSDPLKLTVSLPPSANRLYRAMVVAGVPTQRRSREYRAYEMDCGSEILTQISKAKRDRRNAKVPAGDLSMTARLHWPDRRKRDADNSMKALQDVVSKTLGFDDSRISEVHVYRMCDPENPRCEVVLAAAEESEAA